LHRLSPLSGLMRVGLRHSRFAGLRHDRDPREVVKEHAEGAAEVAGRSAPHACD